MGEQVTWIVNGIELELSRPQRDHAMYMGADWPQYVADNRNVCDTCYQLHNILIGAGIVPVLPSGGLE